jgi:transglutaminase/protease-like cytokinesis protein 3
VCACRVRPEAHNIIINWTRVARHLVFCAWEEFEDTKGVIRIRKSKDRQHSDQIKRTNEQTKIYKTWHRKLNVEQHESNLLLYYVLLDGPYTHTHPDYGLSIPNLRHMLLSIDEIEQFTYEFNKIFDDWRSTENQRDSLR